MIRKAIMISCLIALIATGIIYLQSCKLMDPKQQDSVLNCNCQK